MTTTVFRVEKNREFVVMSNKFLRNKEMSLKAKGLLALCLSLPDDWNYSLSGLVAICKESLTSIRSALKELEEFGHLKREKKKDEKGQFIYEYILFEHPHTDFLHMDNLHTETLPTDNDRQQSIKKQIIKEPNIDELYMYIKEHTFASIWTLLYDFLEMRNGMGTPMTMRGLKMLISRLEKLSNGDISVQRLMLENAIMNQWKNVYRPKEQELKAEKEVEILEKKAFYGI